LLINNNINLGFIKTVNKGFDLSNRNIILLNTDAFVPENWLERLLIPMLLDNSIATVTPMTNNGEIANVPVICKSHLLLPGVAEIIDLCARKFDPITAVTEIPTGVGFCMAMSCHWLKKVPNFDVTFGRGYGEEVDWCQRVYELGGKHLLTGALFVEHRGGMSFGSEKQARIEANNIIVSQRYPYYDKNVQKYIAKDPSIAQRLALGVAFIASEGDATIYLAHRLGGGAEMWLKEIISGRLTSKKSTIIIRDGDYKNTVLVELHTVIGVTAGNIFVDEISEYLEVIKSKNIIYSCLVGSVDPLVIMDSVVSSLKDQDGFKILFHDFFPICPSYTLIGFNDKYCKLPEASKCESCYKGIIEKTGNISKSIAEWRKKWDLYLTRANEVEVFSESSKEIVEKIWPTLINKIKIKPHKMVCLPKKINNNKSERLKIGVLGVIGYQKGAKILYDISEESNSLFDIVIIGEIDQKYLHKNMRVHGKYAPSEISFLAEKYKINCWFIPSIWPETFSFTTRECLATGLPTYTFDLGAQSEAVNNHICGRVLSSEFDIKEIIRELSLVENNYKEH
jgi:hypothetical protein